MLKLEKNQHTQDLKITFQQRDRFFNRSLIFALTLAIAIHAFSWLLFTIAPLTFNFPDSLPTPIVVEADPQHTDKNRISEQIIFSELEQRKIAKRSLIEPAKRKMTLPMPSPKNIDLTLHVVENENLLTQNSAMSQLLIDDALNIPLNLPKISIQIFGPLANKTLLSNGLKEEENVLLHRSIKTLKQQRLTFDVLMDQQEGRLIWFLNTTPSQIVSKQAAETILKNMRFTKSKDAGMTKGTIEIVWVE